MKNHSCGIHIASLLARPKEIDLELAKAVTQSIPNIKMHVVLHFLLQQVNGHRLIFSFSPTKKGNLNRCEHTLLELSLRSVNIGQFDRFLVKPNIDYNDGMM